MRPLRHLRARTVSSFAIGMIALMILSLASAKEVSKPDPKPSRFESEIHEFEAWDKQNSWPSEAVLFAGSSSIRMWPTAEAFPNLVVINRGFGGSQISDVNHYLDRVALKYKPRAIVFYAGDNDIADGKPPEQVFEDFEEFVNRVHEDLPETRIIYLPIKPSLARWKLWPRMNQTNALVEQLADEDERLEYVDTAAPMLGDDGRPRSELFLDDGLHMTPAGYQVWNAALAPVLEAAVSKD